MFFRLCLSAAIVALMSHPVQGGSDRAQWKCTKENNYKCQRDPSHCRISKDNCNGCINHIKNHMTQDGSRSCNEKRLKACYAARDSAAIGELLHQYNQLTKPNSAQHRIIMDVNHGRDCIIPAGLCRAVYFRCAQCIRNCGNLKNVLGHIGLLVRPQYGIVKGLAERCQSLQNNYNRAGGWLRAMGILRLTGQSHHCGLP